MGGDLVLVFELISHFMITNVLSCSYDITRNNAMQKTLAFIVKKAADAADGILCSVVNGKHAKNTNILW